MSRLFHVLCIGLSIHLVACGHMHQEVPAPSQSLNLSRDESLVSFDYRAYPKELIVEYDVSKARQKANARQKEKKLPHWDAEIADQYDQEVLAIRESVFSKEMPSGIELVEAMTSLPMVILRVHDRQGYEWLRANTKLVRIHTNNTYKIQPDPVERGGAQDTPVETRGRGEPAKNPP